MIPVTQTILYQTDSVVLGNCLQAAVASIYELPIDAVPHFVQFEKWGKALDLYVAGRGFGLTKLSAPEVPMGVPVLAFGTSPRGEWGHSVVWLDGAIAHDPHPSRAGLAGEPYEFWHITDEIGDTNT